MLQDFSHHPSRQKKFSKFSDVVATHVFYALITGTSLLNPLGTDAIDFTESMDQFRNYARRWAASVRCRTYGTSFFGGTESKRRRSAIWSSPVLVRADENVLNLGSRTMNEIPMQSVNSELHICVKTHGRIFRDMSAYGLVTLAIRVQ